MEIISNTSNSRLVRRSSHTVMSESTLRMRLLLPLLALELRQPGRRRLRDLP